MPSCDRCERPGRFRLSEAGVERWYCEVCVNTLPGAVGISEIALAMTRASRTTGECPYCKTKPETAIREGLVGCPLCYESLGDEVWSAINLSRTVWTRMDVW